jgi:hypothetical protein
VPPVAEKVTPESAFPAVKLSEYQQIAERGQYAFGCPVEGVWRARLDAKAWGKSKNILLYFSAVETDTKHALSVFWPNGYRPAKGGFSFRDEGEAGDMFELETAKTKTGTAKLVFARKIDERS